MTISERAKSGSKLSPSGYARLTAWLDQRRNEEWDHQMDKDAASDKLDFLFEEAENKSKVIQGIEDIVTGKMRALDEDEFRAAHFDKT